MSKGTRSRNARLRASFARSERLKREAGPERAPGQPQQQQRQDRTASTAKSQRDDRPRPAQARERTPDQLARARLDRFDERSARRRLERLQTQTRAAFDRAADRRDQALRTERDRQRQRGLATVKRVQEQRQREEHKRANLRRAAARQTFNRQADRRQDLARRADHARQAAQLAERQQELQRRAAAEVEREQKRRALDQQAAHRRHTDETRSRHKVERNSFRINENTAMERHHHAVAGIDGREARVLAEFDGRRRGLVGRMAELVPGRRAENDRQREEMKRGFESERLTKHRDLEALKERQFAREQQHLRDQAGQRKALMELHRSERATMDRDQAAAQPRLIEERSRVIERADRAHEQERERAMPARENVRPSEDFAAGNNTAVAQRELDVDAGREIPSARTFERA